MYIVNFHKVIVTYKVRVKLTQHFLYKIAQINCDPSLCWFHNFQAGYLLKVYIFIYFEVSSSKHYPRA